MKIRQLLVPTDFSNNAQHAIDFAVELSQQSEATIHLLHVPQIPTYFVADVIGNPGPKVIEEVLTYASTALDEAADAVKAKGVRCEAELRQGRIHEVIRRYVNDHAIDLVVLGTHGRRGFSKMMYGSVTERALATAEAPMLVVPPSGAKIPQTVVVAYDFSDSAKNAAAMARAIHGVVPGSVHLVHSYVDVWAEYTDLGNVTETPAERRMEALRQGLTEMLERDVQDLFSIDAEAVQIHLVEGDAARGIVTVANEVNADLICAGASVKRSIERFLIGSVARKLLPDGNMPVLFAPGED